MFKRGERAVHRNIFLIFDILTLAENIESKELQFDDHMSENAGVVKQTIVSRQASTGLIVDNPRYDANSGGDVRKNPRYRNNGVTRMFAELDSESAVSAEGNSQSSSSSYYYVEEEEERGYAPSTGDRDWREEDVHTGHEIITEEYVVESDEGFTSSQRVVGGGARGRTTTTTTTTTAAAGAAAGAGGGMGRGNAAAAAAAQNRQNQYRWPASSAPQDL